MPAVEQHQPSERPAAPAPPSAGFHSTLNETWGPGANKPAEQQPSNALDGFGQFMIGIGDGISAFANETAKAAGQAITHPGETIKSAVNETGKALKTGCDVTVSFAHYVGDKVLHGDINGVAHDAQQTGKSIGYVVAEGANHIAHMNARELGKFVGHDVLAGVVASVVAPELAGEGLALAAGAMSKLGTLAKEEAVLSRVVSVCENAKSKIDAISEKMAGLNKKMEALQEDVRCTHKMDKPEFEHIKPPITHESSPVSDSFKNHVEECKKSLDPSLAAHLDKKGIEIHAVGKISDLFKGFDTAPACCITNGERKGIYIAEKVWHDNDWAPHHPMDVLFNMFHESGHAINATLSHDYLSGSSEFETAFNTVWDKIDKTKGVGRVLDALPNIDRKKDEVFADLWGHMHATPHVENEYSNTIRRLFAPVYEHMKTKPWEVK